ncbi:MAG: hypothetical protein LBJ04_17040 [Sphingobacterium sp.]|jgi:hypothetical protein|nr:hypothetical protein [Sphingobacterium sp.]
MDVIVVGSPLDLLYNNAQGLEQITLKTVWKEGNMMASRSLGTCPSNKEE